VKAECPQCHGVPSLMIGALVPNGIITETYLVCWRDNLMMKNAPNQQWLKFTKRKFEPEWTKFTPHHWQTIIDGSLLDYWPTKKKWHFLGKTHTGDVQKFIEGVVRGEHE
jgi:hypothetical protein